QGGPAFHQRDPLGSPRLPGRQPPRETGFHLCRACAFPLRKGKLVSCACGLRRAGLLSRSGPARPAPRRKLMSDRTSFYPELAREIAPAEGRLGVLLPGLGAVATTLVAGVALIEKGLARPFGSLTQMQSLRLGKRTQPRWKPIREIVPLAALSDLVFGGWDIFPDNAFETATKAGVVPPEMLAAVRAELEALQPWPAVFEHDWVRNLNGTHKKSAPTKKQLAECLIDDIQKFRK